MIQNVYVHKANGELVFNKNLAPQKIDENVVVGFLAAVGNFSKEAFKNFIEVLDIGDDRKLILHYQQKEKLIAAAIVDDRDENGLVQKVLAELTQAIIEEYGSNPDPEKIDATRTEAELERILKGRTAARNPKTFWIGLLVMIGFIVPLTFASTSITQAIGSAIIPRIDISGSGLYQSFLPAILLISICFIFAQFTFPALAGSFIIGRLWLSFFAGCVYFAMTLGLLYGMGSLDIFYISLAYTPLVVIFLWFFSFLGVRLASVKKLFK